MATKKYTLKDIVELYEKKQRRVINDVLRQIMSLFDEYATKAAFLTAKRKLVNNRFLPKDVRESIDRITNTVNAKSKEIIINGIKAVWILSEEKNDIIETKVAGGGRKIPPGVKLKVVPGFPEEKRNINTAVDEYVKRKKKGLGLSKRIWKLSPVFKKTVNDAMIEGLKNGTPARDIAKKIRKSLRSDKYNPNPGQGIYKNPQKNAERVSRTEINMAYRNADYERWQKQWFVIAIDIRLSNNHPTYDICDPLSGRYPKEFRFMGWHPNCLCHAVPVLATQDVRDKMMDYRLGLRDDPPKVNYISSLTKESIEYFTKNAKRIAGWKNEPYWLSANKEMLSGIFK